MRIAVVGAGVSGLGAAYALHCPNRITLGLRLLRHLPYPVYFAAVRRFTQKGCVARLCVTHAVC